MGKKDREHKKRAQERNLRLGLGNPIVRKLVAFQSRGAVTRELQSAPTEDQIDVLNRTMASGNASRLRQAITSKAPAEMDKAIRKLQKEGKEVSADSLCAEIRSTPSFLKMCENVGLDLAWFEKLAEERMKVIKL